MSKKRSDLSLPVFLIPDGPEEIRKKRCDQCISIKQGVTAVKKNTAAVKLLFVVLFVLSAVSIVSAQNISVYELDDEDLEKFLYLGDQLYSSSVAQNMQDIYTEMQWTPVYDFYPQKFDLRENGTVPPSGIRVPGRPAGALPPSRPVRPVS